MRQFIEKVRNKENLTHAEMEAVMRLIVDGKAANQEIADFLLALNAKGPTVEEITGAAKSLRSFAIPVPTKHRVVLDTCGTGGDRKDTFNISTVAALVVAGAGVVVAKHGNRSITSRCGSACILEALGVNLNVEEKRLGTCLDEIGIAFLFAQRLHPAMKRVAVVRKELGVQTLFNLLGPLLNPARATHQMMGVNHRDLVEPMAQVLKNLGLKRGLVVHGSDGLDEITTTAKSFVSEFADGQVRSYTIEPREVGIPLAKENDLKGGGLPENRKIFKAILQGQPGPKRDIVVLNSAYAFYTAERVKDIKEGIALAEQSIDSGNAQKKLDALISYTQQS